MLLATRVHCAMHLLQTPRWFCHALDPPVSTQPTFFFWVMFLSGLWTGILELLFLTWWRSRPQCYSHHVAAAQLHKSGVALGRRAVHCGPDLPKGASTACMLSARHLFSRHRYTPVAGTGSVQTLGSSHEWWGWVYSYFLNFLVG